MEERMVELERFFFELFSGLSVARTEHELLTFLCHSFSSRYACCWVGQLGESGLDVVAGGRRSDLPEWDLLQARGDLRKRLPMASPLLKGQVFKMEEDGPFPLWRGRALAQGYLWCVCTPLLSKMGEPLVLTLYSRSHSSFDPSELKRLFGVCDVASSFIRHFREARALTLSVESLRRSEEMYRAVFENTGTGTIIIDREMTILFSNERFETMVGFGRDEIVRRMKWSEFVVPEDRERMQRYHYGRRKGRASVPMEYECRISDKKGHLVYIHMKVGMIPGTMNSIASFMDITERKLAETNLKKSEAKLSAILTSFDGIVFVTDGEKRVVFSNGTLEDRMGGQAIGRPCHQALFGLERPCSWCSDEEVFKRRTVHYEVRSPLDGKWYFSIRTPIFDENGSVVRVQSIVLDITDRKLSEEAMEESARHLRRENRQLRSTIRERYKFGDIVGKSPVMQEVYDLILKASASSVHVMIYGESGTGKELVARAIHAMSERSSGPFVPVNCGAISENIIESEFFGYKKGAFTGANEDKKGFLALADGGTLFLDEIGEIGHNMQVKLLRAIDGSGYTPVGSGLAQKSNIRIVAATNRNLKELVQKGLMREDFYYRVHIIPIKLPPLRLRREDIPLLIDHFFVLYGKGREVPPFSGQVLAALTQYPWPGNIRELQNMIKRYITLKKIDLSEVFSCEGFGEKEVLKAESGVINLSERVLAFEKGLIQKTLEKTHWQKGRTAELLGIHRKTLFTKMRKHGLK